MGCRLWGRPEADTTEGAAAAASGFSQTSLVKELRFQKPSHMWDPPLLRKDTRRHQNESALEGAVIITAITLSPGRLRVVWVTSCVTPSPFWGIFSWADFSLSLAAVKSQTGQCWREISYRNLYVLSDCCHNGMFIFYNS